MGEKVYTIDALKRGSIELGGISLPVFSSEILQPTSNIAASDFIKSHGECIPNKRYPEYRPFCSEGPRIWSDLASSPRALAANSRGIVAPLFLFNIGSQDQIPPIITPKSVQLLKREEIVYIKAIGERTGIFFEPVPETGELRVRSTSPAIIGVTQQSNGSYLPVFEQKAIDIPPDAVKGFAVGRDFLVSAAVAWDLYNNL